MPRLLSFLFGPELYWIITCIVVRLIGRRGLAPDAAITAQLDRYWTVLPLVVVPLTYLFFLVPGLGRWWLLLRIDLAIAIGIVVATTQYCEAMNHHDASAGPGVGTAWMVMIALGYTLAIVGTIIAAIVIAVKARG